MREKSIKYWNAEERPREKMITRGKESLTKAELIAIIIRAGSHEKSALEVAYEILEKVNHDLNRLSQWDLNDYKQIKGVGDAKALSLKAVFELARRREMEDTLKPKTILSTKDAGKFLVPMLNDATQEKFVVLYLNNAHKILHSEILSQGGLTATVVDIRLILKTALQLLSPIILIAHNHPSGNLKPSQADINLTNKITKACSYLDIKLLDHLIIGNSQFLSFADEGLL